MLITLHLLCPYKKFCSFSACKEKFSYWDRRPKIRMQKWRGIPGLVDSNWSGGIESSGTLANGFVPPCNEIWITLSLKNAGICHFIVLPTPLVKTVSSEIYHIRRILVAAPMWRLLKCYAASMEQSRRTEMPSHLLFHFMLRIRWESQQHLLPYSCTFWSVKLVFFR